MEKVVILGGGIAGLSCLNALLDIGVDALLIEANTIGSPKMCGEFLAPKAVSLLQLWDIGPIVPIDSAQFFTGKKQLSIAFPKQAGAIARDEVERQLAQRAFKLGGRIRENTSITNTLPKTENTLHIIELSSGETVEAHTVFFAIGKFGKLTNNATKPIYTGMKLHFKPKQNPSLLHMYCFEDAYLGVVPISNDVCNSALLIKKASLGKSSIFDYFQKLLSSQPKLNELFDGIDFDGLPRIEGHAPHFKLKDLPDWLDSYWIGDAFASLYPAIGSGFSHGIQSAKLAAQCYQNTQVYEYHKRNLSDVKPKLFWGKCINHILQRPYLTASLIPVLQKQPKMLDVILNKIGYIN